MSAVLDKVRALSEDPYAIVRREKAQGRKVVGVTPMHFPEELIHAAGALPVVLQETNEPVTLGFGSIYPFYCGFSRSNVDWAVKGKLGLFDAIGVSDVCLQLRHMAHIMRRHMNTPFAYINWPLEANSARWLPFTLDKLNRCRTRLEGALGARIEDGALSRSITLFNRHRQLLRRVYELRQQKPGALKAKELVGLVMSGMVMPKEEHIALLEEFLPQLEKATPRSDGRVRVFLSGHLCQAVKYDILDLVEDMGGVVVGDDLYTGYRYFAADVPANSSPLEALARRYLELPYVCPTRLDTRMNWGQYLVKQAREHKAQGIVALVVKFCEPHMIYYPFVKDVLTQAGVPHLLLETEHEVVSLEGTRTRLQAFMEMLRR